MWSIYEVTRQTGVLPKVIQVIIRTLTFPKLEPWWVTIGPGACRGVGCWSPMLGAACSLPQFFARITFPSSAELCVAMHISRKKGC